MDFNQKSPMAKQNSSLFFISLIDYLNKKHPEIDVQILLDEVNFETPFYVENLKTGSIELVTIDHMKDENYWFSHLFINEFSKTVRKHIPDPNLFYDAGDSVYHTHNFLKTAVGVSFIGPRKMLMFLQRENNKYNRTKDMELLKSENGHAVFRAVFFEGIISSPLAMEWGAGLVRSYCRLSGATDVEVSVKWIERGPVKPGDKGRGICEFEVTYKDPGILTRLFKLLVFRIPIVKKEIDHAIKIQAEHKEQIINRERIIEEKTNELKKANEKLLELDKLKTEFYTNVTHELRTPLTLIKSQIEAIQHGHFGQSIENTSDIFDSVIRNVELLTKLIDNILDLSKIEAGKMTTSFKRISLSELLTNIHSNFESAAKYKNLKFEFINKTNDMYALLDRDLFRKAIYNLLFNAIKFTPSGGNIYLLLNENENKTLISVKDTGIGIAKEYYEAIFERFRQVDSSSTRKYEGTGIGLSLAKQIINLHNGDISVESEQGKGSTFTIAIPKISDQIGPEDDKKIETTSNEQPIKLNKKNSIIPDNDEGKHSPENASFTVLIVEDNDDLRSFLKKLVISKHKVLTAKNGKEALTELKKGEIDLVITDIMMPMMDGLELLKNIRKDKHFAWLPVIMLTARVDFPMKMKGFSHGANDYIVKPFQPDELLARIQSQLSLVTLRREFISALKDKNEKPLTDKTIIAIEKVKNYINLNFRDSISRENLSSVVDMSPDHLSRMFKKHTGITIKDFINELRIETILEDLKRDEKKIVDIAFDAGFENLSSFNRVFKKIKGINPTEYKKRNGD